MTNTDEQYGPLGPGRAPTKDPMKGLVGVCAAAMSMEAISFYLVLTVIAKVQEGALWTTSNIVFVTALATVMLIMSFLQRMRWAMPLNIALQLIALVGFAIHPSMGIMALIYAAVWWYILHLRKNLIERMRRGLLVTQHLG